MADDRKDSTSAPSAHPEGIPEGDGNVRVPFRPQVPFVPVDDSANMTAIIAGHRHRASPVAAGLTISGAAPEVLIGTGTLAADAVVLPADWKTKVLRRLDVTETALGIIEASFETIITANRKHAGIGHNNPPETDVLSPLDLSDLRSAIVAIGLLRVEVNAERPRSDVIRVCGLVLNQLVKRVAIWLGRRLEVFIDAALAEAGKRLVQGAALVALMEAVHADLSVCRAVTK